MRTIILAGDSICRRVNKEAGYAHQVIGQLGGKYKIKFFPRNFGSTWKHLAFSKWYLKQEADLIHVNAGLHDLKRIEWFSGNFVPIEQYAANLKILFERLEGINKGRVIWATSTPVIESRQNGKVRRLNEDVISYNHIASDLAKDYGIPVNDLYGVIIENGIETCISDDGVHLSIPGEKILGDAVSECIKKRIRELPRKKRKKIIKLSRRDRLIAKLRKSGYFDDLPRYKELSQQKLPNGVHKKAGEPMTQDELFAKLRDGGVDI